MVLIDCTIKLSNNHANLDQYISHNLKKGNIHALIEPKIKFRIFHSLLKSKNKQKINHYPVSGVLNKKPG